MAGMIEVARATVTIVPNMAGAQEEISSQLGAAAESAGTSAGSAGGRNFVSALGRGLAGAGAAVAATTAAIGAAGTALYNSTAAAAEYGDTIDKNSQRLGISTQAYQEWDYVMQISGTSMENMRIGMKTLTNQVEAALNGSESAQAAFESLGISMDDLANMSREDVFEAAIYGFQGMEDSVERAALANDLFGRSGQELTPLFNQTAESTRELIEQANEYGIVMSDEAVSASTDFKDALTTVNATVTGLKNSMLTQLMPSMTTVMNGLSKVFAGDEAGMAEVQSGVEELASTMNSVLPSFLDLGVSIITTLLDSLVPMLPSVAESLIGGLNLAVSSLLGALPALIPVVTSGVILIGTTIIQNLPLVISSGMELLMALVSGIADASSELIPVLIDCVMLITSTLLDHLDELIGAGLEILVAVIRGISDALPELAAMIPEVINTITSSLIAADNIELLVGTALEIMLALGGGLIEALPEIVAMIPEIIDGILSAFSQLGVDLAADALEWGGDMIGNFIDGINGAIGGLSNAVSGVASTVRGFLHFSKPDVGPLSDFDTYAPDMIDLFTEGLEDGERQIQGTFEEVLTLPDPNTSADILTDSSLYVDGSGTDTSVTIPVYIGQDKLDTIVLKSLRANTYRRGG